MDLFEHSLLLLLLLLLVPSSVSALNSEGLSLLALKAAITTDPTHSLTTWSESSPTPCTWFGITCNPRGRVTQIRLTNLRFNGYIPSELGALVSLKHLSLSHNNFTKTIPSHLFHSSSSLLSLDLSHNSLTGPIPTQIKTVTSLVRLDLSSNLFNGSLPPDLPDLPNLSGSLNLSYNRFFGEVPASFGRFPLTVSLDLRHNNLTGKIPQIGSLLNQGPTAFAGNPNLCGFPTRTPCPEAGDPGILPENPRNPENPNSRFESDPNRPQLQKPKGGSLVTVPIISGVSFIVGAVSVSVWLLRKKWGTVGGKMGKDDLEKKEKEKEKEKEKVKVREREREEKEEEGHNDEKFVVMDEGFGLELEDLLRASAYVVGKSKSGIVYKVVAGRGSGGVGGMVAAVRRLSEGGEIWRLKEFEAEVEAMARVQHPNIVRLRAYYYASDEKLLVSDFVPNGSLYSALHGFAGVASNSLSPLPWPSRLKIAQGVARGLMYIHECNPRKYVHGSIKSSKILLDEDHHPYISGFGLTRLISSSSKPTNSASRKQSSNHNALSFGINSKDLVSPCTSYLAPEARISSGRLTQKCDIYSFGVVLLELLTGRLPEAGPEKDEKELECHVRKAFRDECPLSEIIDPGLVHEVYAKKQVLAVFHVALNCTELVPEMRPRMKTVLENLERVESL